MSTTETVLGAIVAGFTSAARIIETTGLEKKQVWNSLQQLKAKGKIRTAGRGASSVIELINGRHLPQMKASTPAPIAAVDSTPTDFRALITHRREIQVSKGDAVCGLTASEALELYRFLDQMEPILTAAAEEAEA